LTPKEFNQRLCDRVATAIDFLGLERTVIYESRDEQSTIHRAVIFTTHGPVRAAVIVNHFEVEGEHAERWLDVHVERMLHSFVTLALDHAKEAENGT